MLYLIRLEKLQDALGSFQFLRTLPWPARARLRGGACTIGLVQDPDTSARVHLPLYGETSFQTSLEGRRATLCQRMTLGTL